MNIADVMDEIADRVRTITSLAGRVYEWPASDVSPPCAMITYPGPGTYDLSYRRGADRTECGLVVLVGSPGELSTRDVITGYLDGSGAESVKATVDGDGTYASCDSVTVTGWDLEIMAVGSMDYLAAVFTLDIVGRGA